ncbi:MAG: amidohydrolase [Crocinitomicaceae bacterium]|nr:amidohydrolase [Crocinitomicaceae bacterium]|tara:strand:- start:11979 stop:15080 length:3102 start_codon:yes stop_codon:yes gene_type:complete
MINLLKTSFAFVALFASIFSSNALAQTPTQHSSTFPINGTVDKHLVRTILQNATVHIDENTTILNGTVVLFRGMIESVGTSEEISVNGPAITLDMKGYHLYPSFVDLHSTYGLPEVKLAEWSRNPQYESNKKGAYGWNQAIRPEIKSCDVFVEDSNKAKTLREAGFGALLIHVPDGISRGTGTLVMPVDDPRDAIIRIEASAHYSFRKGSSKQNYPSSLMGSISLLRQTHFDARWYNDATKRGLSGGTNLSLEAFNNSQNLPQIFSAGNWKDILRADKIAKEFGLEYIVLGGGDSYQRAEAIAQTGSTIIVPVNYPTAYDLSDPFLARFVSLTELKHWELAPSNASILNEAGVNICFTSEGLRSPSEFLPAVRKAVERGLPENDALAALTSNPAEAIGAENLVGTISPGLMANIIVTDGPLFKNKTKLVEHWVSGEPTIILDRDALNLKGDYSLTIGSKTIDMIVDGEIGMWEATEQVNDTTTNKINLNLDGRTIVMSLTRDQGLVRMTGNIWMDSRIWEGTAVDALGNLMEWSAVKTDDKQVDLVKSPKDSTDVKISALGEIIYPFTAYGSAESVGYENVVIRGATVWTCEDEGIIEDADILISEGQIISVSKRINPSEFLGSKTEFVEVDGRGKHVTPGIIDEHSHIIIERGVNEGTQASSAEVWIGSSLNSEDVNMYRQLAGGVTCAQLLHGSANPIGGQSAIVKFRWGSLPSELLYQEASPFIKFALGENVKQSNWGDMQTTRFPQSRMGVEQVFYDNFIRAREYGLNQYNYRQELRKTKRRDVLAGRGPLEPRRDLELDALLQILNEERFITCHSYRQDEINMLMHVADSMGFRLNTFTHILEGYKVADKMKAHGVGGSTFSDWWAYKYEVKDAIPYNAAVLYDMGITTAINSDDAEMGRRLNQEAAKAVKYGGVPQEEALKMVTLNPAKLLHIDHKTGSIKKGKDADVVIWDDNPLSMNAQVVATYVEGRCLFSIEKDTELRTAIKAERARLTEKMLNSSTSGEKLKKPSERIRLHYHCDTLTEENR